MQPVLLDNMQQMTYTLNIPVKAVVTHHDMLPLIKKAFEVQETTVNEELQRQVELKATRTIQTLFPSKGQLELEVEITFKNNTVVETFFEYYKKHTTKRIEFNKNNFDIKCNFSDKILLKKNTATPESAQTSTLSKVSSAVGSIIGSAAKALKET
jgi:uncharacterized protein YjaZ